MNSRATVAENTERICRLIQSTARRGAEAILFPECAITGYWRRFTGLRPDAVAAACTAVAEAARQAKCHVLVGSPRYREGHWFNELLLFNRQGRLAAEYAKIHLTAWDTRRFSSGNALAYFHVAGVPATAIICHERRYPELVRLPVMLGAQIVFHPNAGLDPIEVSRTKRGGRDGIVARAFENQVYYVFANSVGQQEAGLWSAGDSKIVAPDLRVLALANDRDETVLTAELDLRQAGRKYARDAMRQPGFLRPFWQQGLALCRQQLRERGSGRPAGRVRGQARGWARS